MPFVTDLHFMRKIGDMRKIGENRGQARSQGWPSKGGFQGRPCLSFFSEEGALTIIMAFLSLFPPGG
jgi:hypothetical protein